VFTKLNAVALIAGRMFLDPQLEKQLSGIHPDDQTELDQAQTEILRLKAELTDLQQTHDQFRESHEDKEIEAETAHGINRAYVNWINKLPQQVRDEYPFERPTN
jgi:hypothetical protein